jgi:HK97 family phage major capsid protein
MAREVFDSWIPVEYADTAIVRPDIASAVESSLNPIPMNSTSKVYPRSGAASVGVFAKGTAIAEDAATNDSVTLIARKIGTAFRIANEDLEDSLADIITSKKREFSTAYARFFDNATLGVTAAENGTTVPFTSVYKTIRTADATMGYSADGNYHATTTAVALTYTDLSNIMAMVETGPFYDPASMVVWADPSFLGQLRNIKDSQQRPIFVQNPVAGMPPSVFGMPCKFTAGARANATASGSPVGNALFIVANPNYLMLGRRSDFEATVDSSASILTDESLLVMRARKAFKVAVPQAAAVLELVP